jgi:hypothetical protein
MKRNRMDIAANAQFDRKLRALRCVDRSGGVARWSHMHSHGHKYPTIRSLVSAGYLIKRRSYEYELTKKGRSFLSDVNAASLANH